MEHNCMVFCLGTEVPRHSDGISYVRMYVLKSTALQPRGPDAKQILPQPRLLTWTTWIEHQNIVGSPQERARGEQENNPGKEGCQKYQRGRRARLLCPSTSNIKALSMFRPELKLETRDWPRRQQETPEHTEEIPGVRQQAATRLWKARFASQRQSLALFHTVLCVCLHILNFFAVL